MYLRRNLIAPASALLIFLVCFAAPSASQTASEPAGSPAPGQIDPEKKPPEVTKKEKADEQIKRQEHQRILGVLPEFNTTSIPDAVSLTAKQKFTLAFHTATDPVSFLIAALDGGYGQFTDNYHKYGQGVGGFAKYFGAAYLDSFDGTMLGNAAFPALLHEDPTLFSQRRGKFRQPFQLRHFEHRAR